MQQAQGKSRRRRILLSVLDMARNSRQTCGQPLAPRQVVLKRTLDPGQVLVDERFQSNKLRLMQHMYVHFMKLSFKTCMAFIVYLACAQIFQFFAYIPLPACRSAPR